MTVRLLLSRTESGRLIGLGAKVIREIRRSSSCSILIDKDTGGERTVSVSGEESDVIQALGLIAEAIEPEGGAMSNKSLKFLFHDILCQRLVSHGAMLLKSIVKDTGVRISVSPVCLPG